MEWGTLIGTVLGAAIGTGAALLAERSRWRRDHASSQEAAKRELYGEYLAALGTTRHRLRDLKRTPSLPQEDRARQAGEILGSGGVFPLRAHVLIAAPESVAREAELAFVRIRELRDLLDQPVESFSEVWRDAQGALGAALDDLQAAMRHDLAASARPL